jgi:hypothetical protein
MNFVLYGIKSSKQQRSKWMTTTILSIFSIRFAIFTSTCIKTPKLPRLPSMHPPKVLILFCSTHRHIGFATRIESLLIAGGSTAPHQAKVDIASRRSSSVAYPPPHSQGLPSTSLTTDPVHVPLQIASVTDRSIHGSIQMISRDLIRLVSTEVSHPPSQPGEFPDTFIRKRLGCLTLP